jgi:hypothetical protein
MGASGHDDELQKKALSMLWNLTISAAGISALVQFTGVATVLDVMRSHSTAAEVQQNALGVLRNISDAPEGQTGILRAAGLPLLLETLRTHSKCAAHARTARARRSLCPRAAHVQAGARQALVTSHCYLDAATHATAARPLGCSAHARTLARRVAMHAKV